MSGQGEQEVKSENQEVKITNTEEQNYFIGSLPKKVDSYDVLDNDHAEVTNHLLGDSPDYIS